MTSPIPRRALVISAALLALACSGANGAEPRASEPRPREEPAQEEPVAPAPEPEVAARPEPASDSACGRALACCRAYTTAVPDVVESSACAGVYEAAESGADARCDAMKEGWRQALDALSGAPSDACR